MDAPALPADPAAVPDAVERPAIVIDTQVIMDWLVFRDVRVQALTLAVTSGMVRWLVAPAMRDEIRHVLGRGIAASYAPNLAFIENQFDTHAQAVAAAEPQPLAGRLVCRDPDDQKFIDLALSTGARWLVSRDKAVLALAKRAKPRGLLILKPESWAPE